VKRIPSSTSSRVLDAVCIFCRKVKYLKKSNSREPLSQCIDDRAELKIRTFAERTADKHPLGLVGCHDMIAAEAKYHASCYKLCTVPPKVPGCFVIEDPCSKAYAFIVSHIEQILIEEKRVIALAEIKQLYVDKQL